MDLWNLTPLDGLLSHRPFAVAVACPTWQLLFLQLGNFQQRVIWPMERNLVQNSAYMTNFCLF